MAIRSLRRTADGIRGLAALAAAATAFGALRSRTVQQVRPVSAFALRGAGLSRGQLYRPKALGQRLARQAGGAAAPAYTLHTYDHCPFCNRVEILLGRHGIPYDRVLYGYGEGAVPEACGGTGYNPQGGPVALTGKKMLPVLEGPDVPAPEGARGMPESLEICSYLIAKHGLVVPCDSGRGDLAAFRAELREIAGQLIKPREIKMPVKDWADARDAAYAKWKYTTKAGFDYEAAEAATPELLTRVNEKLKELVPMIRGADSMNVWGWGVDDVVLLPDLRRLTCVKGVVFPEVVAAYMDASLKKTMLYDYSADAI
mmetsp:Transcript_11604/g.32698  ORF Transcript_11604/g.32698 Transcript_11604/m.32698 type:complete len:314 (-) Transcript_11604:59-1000(-)